MINEEEFSKLIYSKDYHTEEDLAQIAAFKAEHMSAYVPSIMFRLMAGRLRAYGRLKRGEKED